MNHYASPESALADLQKRGFVHDLSIQGNYIECEEAFTTLRPGEFMVAEVYRFENQPNSDDFTLIYAIDSVKGLRGILLQPAMANNLAFADQKELLQAI